VWTGALDVLREGRWQLRQGTCPEHAGQLVRAMLPQFHTSGVRLQPLSRGLNLRHLGRPVGDLFAASFGPEGAKPAGDLVPTTHNQRRTRWQ
jgi:hypothetical protein